MGKRGARLALTVVCLLAALPLLVVLFRFVGLFLGLAIIVIVLPKGFLFHDSPQPSEYKGD